MRQPSIAVLVRMLSVWMAAAGLMVASGTAQAQVSRVSVDNGGTQAIGASQAPSISADGRYVAFTSAAANLSAGDTNGVADIYLKDRQTGGVVRVSVKSDGSQSDGESDTPSVSGNGRYVAFLSYAALVPEDTRTCTPLTPARATCADIYVRDTVANETTRVSVASDGSEANGGSYNPVISAGGRFVLFESDASNLVPGDTNGARDIFLRDRLTNATTRVSVSSTGEEANAASRMASFTDDDTVVAFVSIATNLDASPDPLPCGAGQACDRVYLRTLASNTTTRVPLKEPITHTTARVLRAQISGDGRTVVALTDGPAAPSSSGPAVTELLELLAYNRTLATTRMIQAISRDDAVNAQTTLSVSANARLVAMCYSSSSILIYDTVVGTTETVPDGFFGHFSMPDCLGTSVSADGMLVAFATSDAQMVPFDTNGVSDAFVLDRDADHDGMSTAYERTFQLDPNDPADAALDPDGDELTNLQEYQRGSHPKGMFKRYLAEGAANDFFTTTIDAFNPATSGFASVVATFTGQNGAITTSGFRPAFARGIATLAGGVSNTQPNLPDQAFSTVIESDQPIAVERTMTWAGGNIGVGYGSSAETAISNPQTTWYFAEGATHGRFDLFYLLQNPSTTDTTATVTYLLPSGPPIVKSYELRALSRRTIYVDQEDGLAATDVSAKIDAGVPIFAERAMYLSTPEQPFAGGTAGAGIAAPATEWFVAEGATGAFFDLYILIGNPSTQDANVTITYLLPGGINFDKTYTVAKQSRVTIGVDNEDPRLAGTDVSARVVSSNGVPIIVERSMWWPSPNWYEGHLTAATTETGKVWAFAGGYVSAEATAETYLLVANPSDTAANVTFKVTQTIGVTPCEVTVNVPAHSRITRGIKADICPSFIGLSTQPLNVGGTVESDGPGIVVERATYWSTPTQFWAAGASTLLTKIQ